MYTSMSLIYRKPMLRTRKNNAVLERVLPFDPSKNQPETEKPLLCFLNTYVMEITVSVV